MAEKKSEKFRLSGIDVLVIVVLVLCVLGLVMRSGLADRILGGGELVTAEVRFVSRSVMPEVAEAITPSSLLTFGEENFGTLRSLGKSDAEIIVEKSDGTPEKVKDTTLRDLAGTVDVSGKMTEDGFYLNGKTYIAAGSTLTVSAGNTSFEILVTGITRENRP